jgi:hypothetical protein
MKVRIKGDSLRLRISRSEVARFLKGDCLEETIHFAPAACARFTYALRQDGLIGRPTVDYTENRAAVLIPAHQANVWAITDQVGISEEISLGGLGSLQLLIEKDFACLDRSDEDNLDTFPNPNAAQHVRAGQNWHCGLACRGYHMRDSHDTARVDAKNPSRIALPVISWCCESRRPSDACTQPRSTRTMNVAQSHPSSPQGMGGKSRLSAQ